MTAEMKSADKSCLYGHSPERLQQMDAAAVWHPFTQMAEYADPLVIAAAEGNYLIDTQGRRYLDGVSSLWCNVHGHRRAEIDAAIIAQLNRVAHTTLLGLGSPPAIELAHRLVEIAPGDLGHVFFSDDGSTAVEVALKIAYQYHRQKPQAEQSRRRFASLHNAYHGDTIGSVSVGGIELFHEAYRPLLFESIHLPSPYCYRCPYGLQAEECNLACATEMEQTIARHGQELAAVIVEPLVQGAAGMLMQPPGYLSRLRAACDAAGCLMIADEVATGFGRTGRMFACQHENVVPDLLCLAKGITGGYLPLAATLARDHVYQAFLGSRAELRTFFHGHTYTGNALAAAAGVASLDVFRNDRVLEGLPAKVDQLTDRLKELQTLKHVGQVRQRGLMVGIELVADADTRQAYDYAAAMGDRVCRAIRNHGVILRPLGDVVVLMPPLSITEAEIDHLVAAVSAAIVEATGE